MASSIIEIILKARDEASKVFNDNKKATEQVAKQAQKSFNEVNKTFSKTTSEVSKVAKKFNDVGNKGADAFKKLSKSQQDAVTKFNMLNKESQNTLKGLNRIQRSSGSCLTEFMGSITRARNQFEALENVTRSWSGSLDYSRSKLQLLGVNTDTFTGKIRVAGTAITTYLGTKWDVIKTKITGVAQAIRGKIGSAIDTIKGKLGGLTAGFSKLKGGATSAGKGLGFLSSAASMTVGMVGYDLVMSMTQAARESINAAGKMQAFGKRLNMSGSEINAFSAECDKLQNDFKKVDMRAVGASAAELGVKLNIPKTQMGELTKMTAVMSSAFVNEGRTQEDAILAVSDAMDGQFKRLQELGITQDKLKANGWNGNLQDTNSLMQAMNKTMEEMGFTETAKGIYSLDDAYKALEVAGGRLLADILIPLTPIITKAVDVIINGIAGLKGAISNLKSMWDGLPDWAQYAIGIGVFAVAIGVAVSAIGGLEGILVGIIGVIGPVITLIGGISWPLVAIVAAIAAIGVAIYELGKYLGWWTDFKSMCDAAWAAVQRLWSAFINHPDVQAIIKGISDAWDWLCGAVQPVIKWLGDLWNNIFPESAKGKVDAVRILIDALGFTWDLLTLKFRIMFSIIKILSGYFMQFYESVLVPFASFIGSVFAPIWNGIVQYFMIVRSHVSMLINVFQQLWDGQISLGTALQMIWNILVSYFSSVFSLIIETASNFAKNLGQMALSAGRKFLNGIVNYVKSLPGRVWNYIVQTASRIRSGAVSWANNARNAAVNTVNNVVNNVQSLPGKIYNEFLSIAGRIKDAAVHVVQAAANFANSVKNKILDILGIHSPGILQKLIGVEFKDIAKNSIIGKAKLAYDSAKNYAQNIISGFQSENINDALNVDATGVNDVAHEATLTPASTADMSMGVDTSGLTEGVTKAYDDMNQLVDTDLQELISMNTGSFNEISGLEQTSMQNIYKHVNSSLLNILRVNKSVLTQNTNTTKNQLHKMQNSTTSVTKSMVKAWNSMKNNIVSAANNIRTNSTKHFDSLANTIKSFYGKLQNPSRWGAGPASGSGSSPRGVGHSGNIMSKLSNIMANSLARDAPTSITISQARRNPFIPNDDISFLNNNNRIRTIDLLRSGVLDEDTIQSIKRGGAGWLDAVSPNVNHIKDTTAKWKMKGPKIMNRIDTGMNFKVADFEGKTPRISFSSFVQMAQNFFDAIPYKLYMNSEWMGSWQAAIRAGKCNCSDGADALIALAHTCGFSAHKVHGHWGNIGHFWAVVNGKKMDTTGWQQCHNWSPAQSHAGPIPRSSGINNTTSETNTTEDMRIDGEFIVTHKFEGLPEQVDEETIVRLIKETTDSDGWIKKLVNNVRFQKSDKRAKTRFERKLKRSKGIGA